MHKGTSDPTVKEMIPFVLATPKLLQLNATWKEQLKTERERVRRTLITGNQGTDNEASNFDTAEDAVVTVIESRAIRSDDNFDSFGSIPPLVSMITKFPSQQTIADEFTLNREQRAAFMIITSHLDGDVRCRAGEFVS